MAMSGTPVLQNAAVVKFDNASDALTDYSDQITASSITPRLTVGSYSVLSTREEQQVTGAVPRGYDISVTVIKTDGSDDLYDRLMDMGAGTGTDGELSAITMEMYDNDEQSGSEKWTGEVVLTSIGAPISKTASSGDVTTVTFGFKAHGGLVRSIVT